MTGPAGQPAPPLRTWRPMAAWTAGIALTVLLLCPGVPFAVVFLHYYRLYLPAPSTDWQRVSVLDGHLLEAAAASAAACLIISALLLLVWLLLVRTGEVRSPGMPRLGFALLRLGTASVIAVTGVYSWALVVKMYVWAKRPDSLVAGWPWFFAARDHHVGIGWWRWHIVYDTIAWFVIILAFYYLVPAVFRSIADRLECHRFVRNQRQAKSG